MVDIRILTVHRKDLQTEDIHNWSTATTNNTDRAAKLKLNMYMENIGLAEGHNVRPTFTVLLNGKSIATVTPNQTALSLTPKGTPGSRYPTDGTIVVDKTFNGNDAEDIILSLDELKELMMGAPLSLVVTQVSAQIPRWNDDLKKWAFDEEWAFWASQIEGSCIKLLVDSGDDGNVFEYYLYVGDKVGDTDGDGENQGFHPSFNLRQVLSFAQLIEERDGKAYIDGHEFPGEWVYGTGSEEVNQTWDSVLKKGEDPLNLPVTKDAEAIVMFIPGERSIPKINYAVFSKDRENIEANISPGLVRITEVNAIIKMNNIGEKMVTLKQDGESFVYKNTTSFDLPASPFQMGSLTVTYKCSDKDQIRSLDYEVPPPDPEAGTFKKILLTDSVDMKGDLTNIIPGDYNGDGKTDFIRQEKGSWDDDDKNTAQVYLADPNSDGTFTKKDLTDYIDMKGDLHRYHTGGLQR